MHPKRGSNDQGIAGASSSIATRSLSGGTFVSVVAAGISSSAVVAGAPAPVSEPSLWGTKTSQGMVQQPLSPPNPTSLQPEPTATPRDPTKSTLHHTPPLSQHQTHPARRCPAPVSHFAAAPPEPPGPKPRLVSPTLPLRRTFLSFKPS